MPKPHALALAALPFLFTPVAMDAHAADAKPLRLIVPYPSGHPIDRVARLLSDAMVEQGGQALVLDNRPAVEGLVGTEMVAQSLPDGHTAVIVSSEHAMFAALGRRLPYHPTRDFTPVTQLAARQLVLVTHPSLPATSVKELIALSKKEPGKLRYAARSPLEALPVELFKLSTGTKIDRADDLRPIADIVDGNSQVEMADAFRALPHVKEARLRALAVGDVRRSEALPDLPTLTESGVKGYQAALWTGVLLPAKTPKAVADRIQGAMAKAVHTPAFKDALAQNGADVVGSPPAVWGKFIEAEIAKWKKVAHTAKLSFD